MFYLTLIHILSRLHRQWVISLFELVFHREQRQTKRLNFGLRLELRLTNHCTTSLLTPHTHTHTHTHRDDLLANHVKT